MADSAAELYEEDFVRWTEEQSRALRDAAKVGANLPLDWENLAEEIESLGLSQRRELRSRLGLILEHFLKLEYSPAPDPRRGWMETIERERSDIELLLQQSPSLSREVTGMVEEETRRAIRGAMRILRRYGEDTPEATAKLARARLAPYTEDQVLGDWFPEDAPLPASEERERPE
jgi:hypothetical protein